jgi:hypothetical protein
VARAETQAGMTVSSIGIRPLEVGIIALTGGTAFLHLSFVLASSTPTHFPFPGLYFLNAVGYLVLIMALYLPALHRFQHALRWLLILFTTATIVGWVTIGGRDTAGFLDTSIAGALLLLLLIEEGQATRQRTGFSGGDATTADSQSSAV